MKFAKKYYLVNEQQYKRLSNNDNGHIDLFEHPNERVVKNEYDKMLKINRDTSLSDYDKVLEHSQSLQKYLNNMKEALARTKKEALLGEDKKFPNDSRKEEEMALSKKDEISPRVKTEGKITPFTADKILSHFKTSKARQKASSLLESFQEPSPIGWDDRSGEVILDGIKLANSNITHLLKGAVGVKGGDRSSRQWLQFKRALEASGVRPTLRSSKQVGSGASVHRKFTRIKKWHCLKD